MKTQPANRNNIALLFPLFGSILFIMLYFIATQFYPGGSQVDKFSKGFSWMNNYWCNLLNENAINGQHNAARPIALTASIVLALTLSLFWYYFPIYTHFKKTGRLIIQYSGILSMVLAFFLFTSFHDGIVNVSGFFGLIALCGTFIGLYKMKALPLLYFGFFNLFLIVLNNYVYHIDGLIIYLPLIQKISFLSFLLWISLISMRFY